MTSPASGRAVEIMLVTASRCHYCDDAKSLLEALRETYPLSIREIELTSDEGAAIVGRYRAPFPPVLVIDGEYFGHGRISHRKLGRALDEASTRGGVSRGGP